MRQFFKMGMIVGSIVLATSGMSRAATLFTEDFESANGFSDGGNITGTHGWATNYQAFPSSNGKTTSTTTLGSGLAYKGDSVGVGGVQHYLSHSLPALTPGATSLHVGADAWAGNTNGGGISVGSGLSDRIAIFHDYQGIWYLFTSPSNRSDITALNLAKNVQLSLDINLVNNTVVGTVSGPDGTFQSAVLPIDPSQLPPTSGILLSQDTRSGLSQGIDFDNIVVSDAVPEPASIAFLGLSGLLLRRRRSA